MKLYKDKLSHSFENQRNKKAAKMTRQEPKYNNQRVKDHHLTRKSSKGGATKGKWGSDQTEQDLGIRVGSPFEDPKMDQPVEANEPRVRVVPEEEVTMTVG